MTGASTGIGAALAMEAVKHGAKVVITARWLLSNKMRTNTNKENQGEGTPENHIIGKLDTDKILPWYIRRGELLEKVKAQCVAGGGSASQVALRFKYFAISPDD